MYKRQQQLQAHAELLQTLHANAQTHKAQLPGEATPEQLPARKALGATLSSLQATEGGQAADTSADNAEGSAVPIGGGQGRIDTSERPDLVLSASGDIASTTPANTLVATGANVSITAGQDTNLLAQRHQAWAVRNGISLFTRGEAKDTQRAVQGTGIQHTTYMAVGALSVERVTLSHGKARQRYTSCGRIDPLAASSPHARTAVPECSWYPSASAAPPGPPNASTA